MRGGRRWRWLSCGPPCHDLGAEVGWVIIKWAEVMHPPTSIFAQAPRLASRPLACRPRTQRKPPSAANKAPLDVQGRGRYPFRCFRRACFGLFLAGFGLFLANFAHWWGELGAHLDVRRGALLTALSPSDVAACHRVVRRQTCCSPVTRRSMRATQARAAPGVNVCPCADQPQCV